MRVISVGLFQYYYYCFCNTNTDTISADTNIGLIPAHYDDTYFKCLFCSGVLEKLLQVIYLWMWTALFPVILMSNLFFPCRLESYDKVFFFFNRMQCTMKIFGF